MRSGIFPLFFLVLPFLMGRHFWLFRFWRKNLTEGSQRHIKDVFWLFPFAPLFCLLGGGKKIPIKKAARARMQEGYSANLRGSRLQTSR